MSGTVLDIWVTSVNKTRFLSSWRVCSRGMRQTIKDKLKHFSLEKRMNAMEGEKVDGGERQLSCGSRRLDIE